MADHNLTPWQVARMAEHQATLLAAERRRTGERPLHPLMGVPAMSAREAA